MKDRGWVCALGCALAAGTTSEGVAQADVIATSTFDETDEGWRISFRGDIFVPQHLNSGGNPGGYISGVDQRIGGQRWFWTAPDAFLGDVSPAYGGSLSFDLISLPGEGMPVNDMFLTQQDVLLTRGALTLSFDDSKTPNESWTSYEVILRDTAGWKNEQTGLPATEADMRFVLGGLEELMLRGDYRGGNQVNGLDTVVLTPEPATLAMLALAAAMLRRTRTA
ncbi:MAG: hypothetical protein FLDDKLPJ_01020 [Phycisphaerae bacterium]|nr:hypothetical protein [Phycisphaerae bacterium]